MKKTDSFNPYTRQEIIQELKALLDDPLGEDLGWSFHIQEIVNKYDAWIEFNNSLKEAAREREGGEWRVIAYDAAVSEGTAYRVMRIGKDGMPHGGLNLTYGSLNEERVKAQLQECLVAFDKPTIHLPIEHIMVDSFQESDEIYRELTRITDNKMSIQELAKRVRALASSTHFQNDLDLLLREYKERNE